ncbi:unnamed protein product [Choristocarpus tenellus]
MEGEDDLEAEKEEEEMLDLEVVEELHQVLGVELEMALCLLASTNGQVTQQLVEELSEGVNIRIFHLARGGISTHVEEVRRGDVAVFIGEEPFLHLEVQSPVNSGLRTVISNFTCRCCFQLDTFGMYTVRAVFRAQDPPKAENAAVILPNRTPRLKPFDGCASCGEVEKGSFSDIPYNGGGKGDGTMDKTEARNCTLSTKDKGRGKGKGKGKGKGGPKGNCKTSTRKQEHSRLSVTEAWIELLSSSPSYRLARALNAAMDSFIWGYGSVRTTLPDSTPDGLGNEHLNESATESERPDPSGIRWTRDLETALLNMVVAVEDDLRLTMGASNHVFGMMIRSMGTGSLEAMVNSLKDMLSKALDVQDATALGRLCANVLQFADMDEMGLGIGGLVPKPLIDAAKGVIRAKHDASDKRPLMLALEEVDVCLGGYMEYLGARFGPEDSELRSLERLKSATCELTLSCACHRSGGNFGEDSGKKKLEDCVWEAMQQVWTMACAGRMRLMVLGFNGVGAELSMGRLRWSFALPINGAASLQQQQQGTGLEQGARAREDSIRDHFGLAVSELQETLMGTVSLGSMLGYRIRQQTDGVRGKEELSEAAMLVNSLLSVGFGYLATREEATVIPLMDLYRAVIWLRPDGGGSEQDRGVGDVSNTHKRLKAKHKDIARILRSRERAAAVAEGRKGEVLSLRINTDIRLAVAKLREHHSDAWVGPALEDLWCFMSRGSNTEPPNVGPGRAQCTVGSGQKTEVIVQSKPEMALPSGDGGSSQVLGLGSFFCFELWLGEEMIAADFGNAVGGSFYVATRFYDNKYRRLQPGFILALVETEVLRSAGFSIWDLGGIDQSPMMAYKKTLSQTVERPLFLARFQESRACSRASSSLWAGVVIPEIKERHLLCV